MYSKPSLLAIYKKTNIVLPIPEDLITITVIILSKPIIKLVIVICLYSVKHKTRYNIYFTFISTI